MLEKYLERILVKKIKELGGLALKFNSPSMGGVPDRIVLLPNGRLMFIELKTESGVLSSLQQLVISRLKGLGFEVHVIYGIAQLKKFLGEL